jgi:DNA-binding response OmpR family regulator
MTILLVDHDRELVDVLSYALRQAGLSPVGRYDLAGCLSALEKERPQLAVLDMNLGTHSGLDAVKEVRQRSQIPVILTGALAGEEIVVRGLDMGADDFLAKPFSYRELIARIRAHLRRAGQVAVPTGGELQVGPLTLNTAEYAVGKEGRRLKLSVTEFKLLHHLMINAGQVVRTAALLHHVWGYDDPDGAEVVRVALHRLRRKLEDDPGRPRFLHTVPGVGVMLKVEPEPLQPTRT